MASNIFLMTLTRAKCRRYYVLFQSLNPSLWHPFSALLVTVWLAFSPTCIFYQGCALREPSGPWLLTFALRHQEYLQLPGGCHACNVWLFQEKLQTVLVWGSVCCVFQSTFDVLLSFSLVLWMESCSKIFFPCQSCLCPLTLYALKSADQHKMEWWWELRTWQGEMSLDSSTNSPHYFYWKIIGTVNENLNFEIRV